MGKLVYSKLASLNPGSPSKILFIRDDSSIRGLKILTFLAEEMNWPPDPKSWADFPAECFWYLLPGIALHIFALVVSLVILSIFRLTKFWRPRSITLIIFHAYLMIAAMIANGIWSCAVWGRLYWTVDYTSDFSPFIPITRNQIEYTWGPDMTGGLNGITLVQLNLVWLALAAMVWIMAFGATRWTIGRRIKAVKQDVAGKGDNVPRSLHSGPSSASSPTL